MPQNRRRRVDIQRFLPQVKYAVILACTALRNTFDRRLQQAQNIEKVHLGRTLA